MYAQEPTGRSGARAGGRLTRGVVALATLLGMLVGVPTALLAFGGDPLPRSIPSLSAAAHTLTTTDRTGHLVILAALWVAWLAWLAFTASVLVELLARLYNRPAARLPGLRTLQRLAAGLLTSVALLAGAATTATPIYAAAPVAVSSVVRAPASASTLVYQVAAGDSLGTVAARMFGRTDDYARILVQNWELLDQAAGPNQPDALRAGWLVRLPAGARDRGPRPGAAGTVLTPDALAHLVQAAPPATAGLRGGRPAPSAGVLTGPEDAVLATGVPTVVAPGVTVTITGAGTVVTLDTGGAAGTRSPQQALAEARAAEQQALADAQAAQQQAAQQQAAQQQGAETAAQAAQESKEAAQESKEAAKEAREAAKEARQQAKEAAKEAREQAKEARKDPAPVTTPVPGPSGGTTPGTPAPGASTPGTPSPGGTTPGTPAPGGTTPTPGHSTGTPGATSHRPASGTPALTPTPGGLGLNSVPTDPVPSVPFVMHDAVPVTAPVADEPAPAHQDPTLLLVAGGIGFAAIGAHLAARRRRRQIVRGPAAALADGPGRRTGAGRALALPDPELDFDRLDLALRDLATLLGGRDGGPLPDIIGSWLVDGAVHLLLTKPCPAPPPWVAHGLRWTLPAHAPAHAYFSGVTAPLPALVTVGGEDDKRIFLDLERLGVVTIGGDPQGATGLLRHVGAELCSGIWSDGVTIGIAGFTQEDTRQLVVLGGGRVHAMDSIPDALDTAVRWIDDARLRLRGLGADDVLGARVTASPAVAAGLSPYALLLAGPDTADMERLRRLDEYLAGRGRGQVAVAATTQARLGRWPMRVDADRQVTMEFLDARVPAVSLAGAELAALAVAPDRPHLRAADQDVPVGRHRAHRVSV